MVFDIFEECVNAIQQDILIQQVSKTDKEFHFQNWFRNRLDSVDVLYNENGRNIYPDFTVVEYMESYEVKGLSYPGRELTYDSNSQVPIGYHKGFDVYYVFGRYPKEFADVDEYPVLDLVICHGDFINNDYEYIHENKSIKGFGNFGNIMIRDRKMYVASTPFSHVDGLVGNQTLIVPQTMTPPGSFKKVGDLIQKEIDHVVVGYYFDLKTNEMITTEEPNPNAGKEHKFSAFRTNSGSDENVSVKYEEKDVSQWVAF